MFKGFINPIIFRAGRTINTILAIIVLIVFFLFIIGYFLLKLPVNLTIKGEVTRQFKILKIGCQGCVSFFYKYLTGDRILKCVNCGTTELSSKLGKNGYMLNWIKRDDRTGEAVCSDCEEYVDLVK